jgi:gamma-glutamyltranspeptidase/glutathione hydrolase
MFYRGDIARSIVSFSEQVGGLLTLEDFANYHAKLEAPVRSTYRGLDLWPSHRSQAPLLQRSISWKVDLQSLVATATYIHVLTAPKLAMADRERYYGDPDFVDAVGGFAQRLCRRTAN